ncbi:MAG: enoyl-CoA hydratase [Dehalococcoidales bacterium]|nr:enoyl-CoA hydratase [Dehalococcoidales bacterium]
MENQSVIVKKENGIATVTMNRPEIRNAMNNALGEGVTAAFESIYGDDSVRAVVFTGAGKAFCAGGEISDLKRIAETMTIMETRTYIRNATIRMLNAITRLEKPVIAMVRGAAVGAGCNLALACDMIIASDNASFGEIFARVGLASDYGGSYFIPRLVGMAKAKELFLTAKMIDSKEAERIGLINQVVPDAELEKTVYALADQFAAGPTRAYGYAKTQLNAGVNGDLASALDREADGFSVLIHSEDHKEGFTAFLEKRPPKFKGK